MRDRRRIQTLAAVLSLCGCIGFAGAARFSWEAYQSRDEDWYRGPEARRIAENVLAWQDEAGSWPKNVDTAAPCTMDRKDLRGTFDNRATTGEMRLLARMVNATGEAVYRQAFDKGLDLILKAQYPTGGWPQCYPPGSKYNRHITFNDGAMVQVMELLKEIAVAPAYGFVDSSRRAAAGAAFDRGVDCILACQIRVNGQRTAWCAQHDERDYRPRPARSYEPVSLNGAASAGILGLLMSLDKPSPAVIAAVKAGVEWYRRSAIEGIRIQNYRTVADAAAPPLWARIYEIETNRPIFCDRDGVIEYDFNAISLERRSGYTWLDDWGKDVFGDYETWRRQWPGLLAGADKVILAIVGDSTVCTWPDADVRRGWGQFIQDYFSDAVVVVNTARSGRSTKTFLREGLWQRTLDQQPDYVLIQFGHNDSHAPGRPESTDAGTDYADNLRLYVDQARQAGAVPVLVTPMYRRKFDAQGRIHDNLLPYAEAMKRVAADMQVPLVDLNAASEKLYLALGPAGVPALANAADDQTHFNETGARAMADLVMAQLTQVEPSLQFYRVEAR